MNISSINSLNTNKNVSLSTKNNIQNGGVTPVLPKAVSKYSSENIKAYSPAFSASLRTKEEQAKYNEIAKLMDSQDRAKLNSLLKKGILLDSNSNDKTSVLDNLYKIATEPRIKGLDTKNILKETINTIDDPFTITQAFGDIPQGIQDNILASPENKNLNPEDLNVHSACCVATSIEFNLANKMPAEFARMVSGVSSENYSVTKNIKLSDIAGNTVDAIWMLNEFNSKYKLKNWDDVEINMFPDRNAIIRARIQTSYKDPLERSSIDVLMQSMLMNVGSQNTYDSLTDTRTGKFNSDNKGLTDIEKTFAEEIAEGTPKISVTYQILDEEGKLVGYECDNQTVQKHLLDALNTNTNVIIGYTQMDENNKVINGHEITIVGSEKDSTGRLIFICNDTDDNNPAPIKWYADELIPLIHHAGLPKEVLKDDVEFVEGWKEALNEYQQSKAMPTNVAP